MMRQYESGLNGEAIAERYLCQQGMSVLARRYRAEDGEIDLIMQDRESIVFIEVKARPRQHAGAGLFSVTHDKQRRLTHAALSFLLEREWMERPVRFDVVEVTRDGILHIPNAFMAVQ